VVGSPEALDRLRFALAVGAAYATHTITDWLSADTTAPMGLMALWPLTDDYYVAPFQIFLAVSRRYWLAETWLLNLRAVIRELLILGPLLWIVVWVSRTRQARIWR
jgi:inner membrane protein